MGNIFAKFDQNTLNALMSFMSTMLYPLLSMLSLTSDLKLKRVHSKVMGNMSAKYNEYAHNSLVFFAFTRSRRDAWQTDMLSLIEPPQRV